MDELNQCHCVECENVKGWIELRELKIPEHLSDRLTYVRPVSFPKGNGPLVI